MHCEREKCKGCPYYDKCMMADAHTDLHTDALEYIQQLENHIGEFTKNVDLLEEEHYRAMECLEKMQFFMGQRAGRELWMSKPKNVQDVDIEQYNHDIEIVTHYIQQLENHIGELTKKVEQLEAAIPKWINVKDRLPEVPKNYNWIEVLCLWKIPEINYVSYRVMRYYGEHNALSFPTGWSLPGDPLDRVTDWSNAMSHWMPLPEPPKEE